GALGVELLLLQATALPALPAIHATVAVAVQLDRRELPVPVGLAAVGPAVPVLVVVDAHGQPVRARVAPDVGLALDVAPAPDLLEHAVRVVVLPAVDEPVLVLVHLDQADPAVLVVGDVVGPAG